MGVGEVEAPSTNLTLDGLFESAPLYILADQRGVAPFLAERLNQKGIDALIVDKLPEDAKSVLYLAGINHLSVKEAIASNSACFSMIHEAASSIAKSKGVLIFVQDTGGDFGLSGKEESRAWAGGIAALAKTAALEWPSTQIKAIDIETHDFTAQEIAAKLINEILYGGHEIEVGLHADGKRIKIETGAPFLLPSSPFPPKEGDVWIISGGARGVTAHCMIALAQKVPLKIALLGRTALTEEASFLYEATSDIELKKCLINHYTASGQKIIPSLLKKEVQQIIANREVRETMKALAKANSAVEYFSVDTSDGEKLVNVVDQIRLQWGPIKGLVHAAGIIADKKIEEKTVDQFQLVFNTKVQGFHHLLHATQNDPLTHLCCFTSVAGRYGNVGQVDYAMGNEILNKVCDYEFRRRNEACLVKALNWGPWAGGMVTPELQKHFASRGLSLISLEEGASVFLKEMTHLSPSVEVVIGERLDGVLQSTSKAAFEIWVDKERYPVLSSHKIHSIPVVPLVMVYEWFEAALRSFRPSLACFSCQKLHVLQGIKLPNYQTEGTLFQVHIEERQKGNHVSYYCFLSDKRKIKFYEATFESLAVEEFNSTVISHLNHNNLKAWNVEPSRIYDPLFHGKDLQVIKQLKGFSPSGAIAMIQPYSLLESEMKNLTLLDGGLQLAVLWIWEMQQLYALPMGFSELKMWRSPDKDENIECEVFCTYQDDKKVVVDLLFMTTDRDYLASMSGVDLFLTANSTR